MLMKDDRRTTDARQTELIDAALHIIATQGIIALTTRSLADRVGLSSGAIFRHFASIDDLLKAVVVRVELVLDSTFPVNTLPPLERLANLMQARTATVGTRLGILRLVLSEQFQLALPADSSRRLAGCVNKTRQFIAQCIIEGQQVGEVRSDIIEAVSTVPIVMGAMQMMALSAAHPSGQQASPDAVINNLLTMLRTVARD